MGNTGYFPLNSFLCLFFELNVLKFCELLLFLQGCKL